MEHNAKVSYRNADASGDERMKRDIVLSEIAKLIVRNPKRVIAHLHQVGVKVNGILGRKKLSRIVSQAMHNSPAFAELMSADIASGHSADGEEFNASGKRKEKRKVRKEKRKVKRANKKGELVEVEEEVSVDENDNVVDDKVDIGALGGAIRTIKGTIGKVFGGKNKNTNPSQAKTDLDASEKALDDKTKTIADAAEPESHLGRNIGIAVGVALVVGVAIFFATRSSKK